MEFSVTDPEGGAPITGSTDENGLLTVYNQAGYELPETGGMGTVLFYALGSLLAVGAAMLLAFGKRSFITC